MSYNGSGVFQINTSGQPVVTGSVISSTAFNALTADLATGLTTALCKDGQSTPTANISLGGFKLTNVALATATGDALSYGRNATVAALTATGNAQLQGTLQVTGATTLATTLTGIVQAASGVISAGTTLATALTYTATQTFSGSASSVAMILQDAVEPITVSATAATGTINLYPSTQSILYYTTNSSANFTINLAFSAGTSMNTALSTGQVLTAVFMNTNGGTAHVISAVQVDGTTSGVTTKWQTSIPGGGNANAIDVYTFAVIKTGNATFTVLASQAPFV